MTILIKGIVANLKTNLSLLKDWIHAVALYIINYKPFIVTLKCKV